MLTLCVDADLPLLQLRNRSYYNYEKELQISVYVDRLDDIAAVSSSDLLYKRNDVLSVLYSAYAGESRDWATFFLSPSLDQLKPLSLGVPGVPSGRGRTAMLPAERLCSITSSFAGVPELVNLHRG